MKYEGYIYKECTKCHYTYNVSVKDNQKHYVCERCAKKANKGNISKVLLKNKNRYMKG